MKQIDLELFHHITLLIAAMLIDPTDEEKDTGFCLPTSTRIFSVQSAYDLEMTCYFPKANYWQNVWESICSRGVCVFIWRTLHDSLPTIAWLSRRNLGTLTSCPHCGNQAETILHVVRDYGPSKNVWLQINLELNNGNIFSLDLQH